MENIISALIERFGNQGKAATALGVTDRTVRNYVKNPEGVPVPMRRLMKSVLREQPALTPPADGVALRVKFSAQKNIHAIQWRGEEGHIEFTDHSVINETISGEDGYNQHILPYVELWEKEWARQGALQGTPEEITAQAIREERNFRISRTDYLMLPDYPISEQERSAWATYRISLREITEQEGFPWKGIEDAPWLVPPA